MAPWGPPPHSYPFLNPANGGYDRVAITIVAVFVGFVAIPAAIIWLGNGRCDAAPRPRAA